MYDFSTCHNVQLLDPRGDWPCFPVLRDVPRPWNFTRVNDFSEVGGAGSWENHDWTNIEGLVKYSPTHIWIERDPNSPTNEGRYFVLVDDEKGEEDEENDNMEHQTDSAHDWFYGGEDYTFSNQEVVQWDLAEAILQTPHFVSLTTRAPVPQ